MTDRTEEHIIQILNDTFNELDTCFQKSVESRFSTCSPSAKSRLIFPKLRSKKTRISEQELKFVFLEQFSQYCKNTWDAYYSVETPTDTIYRFSKKDEKVFPHVAKQSEEGESARMDLCIHNQTGDPICLIEFKAGKPCKSNAYNFVKDFLKLSVEGSPEEKDEIPCYFVHLLAPGNNYDTEDLRSALNKTKRDVDKDYITEFSNSLEKRKNLFYIFHIIGQNYPIEKKELKELRLFTE